MVRFGFHLGAAFQIQDDLLNLVGDESLYGKEINGDLREGKRTLVLIHSRGRPKGPTVPPSTVTCGCARPNARRR
jgi:geranylgeranyl diphosphate synthase type II